MLSEELCQKLVLVFDFDGVIIESNAVKTEAFRKVYTPFGAGIADEVVLDHKMNQGVSRYEKFKKWHKNFLGVTIDDVELKNLSAQFSSIVMDMLVEAPLVDGVVDFLETHHKLIPMYIASATPQKELEYIANKKKINGYFKAINGYPTAKLDVLLKAKKQYHTKKVVMIGDAKQDMLAAQDAGTYFIARICNGNERIFSELPQIKDFNNFSKLLSDKFTNVK